MAIQDITTFDWDDEIEQESEFTLLDPGDYDFEIVSFERGQFDGSDKTPACKMATVNFEVTDGKGNSTTLSDRFYLASNMEWKLSMLFKSVGLKETGKRAKMDWNALPGKTGRCKVIQKKGTQSDNMFNAIDKLYAKADIKKGSNVWG